MIVDREDILVYSGGVEKSNFRLEDLTAYRISSGLSDYVWDIVAKWDSFNKFTLGQQWVNATDSISGNIA
ncbi:MAG: four helix bundle protein, partial [candidate division WWE3 bacterium]|nr:four helix bundle protein [candidate division WWE3 bacterium]